jgi:hypothetical protein
MVYAQKPWEIYDDFTGGSTTTVIRIAVTHSIQVLPSCVALFDYNLSATNQLNCTVEHIKCTPPIISEGILKDLRGSYFTKKFLLPFYFHTKSMTNTTHKALTDRSPASSHAKLPRNTQDSFPMT